MAEKLTIEKIDEVKVNETPKTESTNDLKIYIVRFRKGAGAVVNLNFGAINDEEAAKKAKAFCLKHRFHHIYTKPFLTDLESWADVWTTN